MLRSTHHFRIFVLFIILLVSTVSELLASHLRAGQITVRLEGRKAFILVEVWTNILNTTVLFGGEEDVLDFGDGQFILIPQQPNYDVSASGQPLPPNVKYSFYRIEHTYEANGFFIVSYREPMRNEGVLNMASSGTTTFYLETKFLIDATMGDNASPVLGIDPIDRACPGVAFSHNPGASDPDFGDSISFVMKIPFSNRSQQVIQYRSPADPFFYTDYEHQNEAGTGRPTFVINDRTGTITWDAPGKVGEYNIAFHVIEYKRINGRWREIGYVRRDMQILVEDCDNERPRLKLPPDTCVIAGTFLEVPVVGTDPDGDKVKIEAFSPIFNGPPSIFDPPASIDPDPGNNDVFVNQPATTIFRWQTECKYVRDQPYFVVFKITDLPDLGPRLATFETWSIKVVGPKPLWDNYTRDEGSRSVTLNWDKYICTNAIRMQVWRKVDGSDFDPATCDTGMPPFLGYELIGTVPIGSEKDTTFTDTNNGRGLEVGPRYCYRLVAIFPQETQAESLVSDDICVDPFELVDPVITNVDVDSTHNVNGRIIVRWLPPLENTTYPPDHAFTYELWRGEGFSGDSTRIAADITDKFYIDDGQNPEGPAGLNTEGTIYNYTVHAYSAGGTFVGSSSQASSVRLEARSKLREIEILWSATVPWTNNVFGYTHKIYRGAEGADTKKDLQLIDEVVVSSAGFIYEDKGQWNSQPLEERLYCYMVETYGTYGNPLIPEPLINRSQIVCAEPGDDIPPCQPERPNLREPRNCDEQLNTSLDCTGTNQYINEITWTRDLSDCGRDISYYIVYYSNSQGGEYKELKRLPPNTTIFEDVLYTSYARCYKIAAVDRSGNVSPLSESFCVDNCPYYELPNVFTPNRDGCNDLFRAYNNIYENGGESGETDAICSPIPPEEVQKKCARFVERVEFHVYNRWGREIYTYTGQAGGGSDNLKNAILINWDGRSNEGHELSTGVYYYIAEVTFISIYPENQHKTIKGWVHLLRGAH